ncbi:CU044_2847 family protein [Streptomyces sp. CWNU-52B]|uniref:CU044_2847 family protein n=1 Tax=unclassified Streptomyces TaxID=2593676 RepID=UPI0039BF64ED
MVILVGPVPEGADGPIPVQIETDRDQGTDDGLGAVYGDVKVRGRATQRVVAVAHDAYTDGLELARRCAAQAVSRFGELTDDLRPDEIEMQLSIKIDAGMAALVTSKAEAQLQVTFRWRTAPETGTSPDSGGGTDS